MPEKSINPNGMKLISRRFDNILSDRIAKLEKELKIERTKCERTEKTLKTLLSFFSSIPHAMNVTTEDHTIVYANKTLQSILRSNQIEGKSYKSFFTNSRIPPDTSIIDRTFASGGPQHGITTLPDGSITECVSSPLVLSDGRKAVINMYLDIVSPADPFLSRGLLGKAVEELRDAIIITDKEGNIIFANQGLLKLTGFEKQELLRSNMTFLLPPELDLKTASEFIKRSTSSSSLREENEILRKDGSRLHVIVFSSPIKDAHGDVTGIVYLMKDISERKAIETKMNYEKKKLLVLYKISLESEKARSIDSLFNAVLPLVARHLEYDFAMFHKLNDKEDRLELATYTYFEEPSTKPPSTIRGKDFTQLRECLGERDLCILRDHEQCQSMPEELRSFIVDTDIRAVTLLAIKTERFFLGVMILGKKKLIESEEEEVIFLRSLAAQLALSTERIKLAESLEKSMNAITEKERFLNNIVENSADGIIVSDDRGMVIIMNRAFSEQTGYTPANMPTAQELLNPDANISRSFDFKDMLSYIEKMGPVRDHERRLKCADGSFILVELSISAYYDEGKNLAGVILMVRDIGERKALEEQLLQTGKLSALGESISSIAHELNNPLTGVIGFAELLSEKEDIDPDTGQIITRIVREANRCKKIVSNLLWFTRKHPSQRIRTNINKLIREIIELKEYELRVSNIKIVENLEENLPETMGDPYLIQQIFFNIVNNAKQAIRQKALSGTIIITTTSDDRKIRATFKDNGPGIPEELQSKIFDPFFTTKLPTKGTGLGLSVSAKIIESHNGRISIASKQGEGAEFTVELPLEPVLEDALIPEEEKPIIPTLSTKPGKILIVDDEESIRDLLNEILAGQKHEISTACEAQEATRKLQENRYDCIISDLRMPGMDGLQLYHLLKEIDQRSLSKLIFITGDFLNDETETFVKESGIPYIKKPFTAEEILEIVNRVLFQSSDEEN